jgi:hypothetical protein
MGMMTSPERIRALAGFIEERTDFRFDMSSSSHCAYAFAKWQFDYHGEDGDHPSVLAHLLQIPRVTAHSLYCSTTLDRQQVVNKLRELAEERERIPRGWESVGA